MPESETCWLISPVKNKLLYLLNAFIKQRCNQVRTINELSSYWCTYISSRGFDFICSCSVTRHERRVLRHTRTIDLVHRTFQLVHTCHQPHPLRRARYVDVLVWSIRSHFLSATNKVCVVCVCVESFFDAITEWVICIWEWIAISSLLYSHWLSGMWQWLMYDHTDM